MAIEIERKFLVPKLSFLPLPAPYHEIEQGYINKKGVTLRVRISKTPTDRKEPLSKVYENAYLTIKGNPPPGKIGKEEFEYQIPLADAKKMLKQMCEGRIIHKRRYRFPVLNAPKLMWEVDVFKRSLKGLIIAEVELPHENFWFPHPTWAGLEVTHDKRYTNKNLSISQVVPR